MDGVSIGRYVTLKKYRRAKSQSENISNDMPSILITESYTPHVITL